MTGAGAGVKFLGTLNVKTFAFLLVLIACSWLVFKNVFKSVYESIRNGVKSQGSEMTLEQANGIASFIKEQFANWIPYNSYSSIKEVLAGITYADYFKIKESFGLVARDFTGAPSDDITSFLYTDKNLTEWLVLELSDSQKIELKELNPIFNKII